MLDPELFLIQRKLKYLKEDIATERYMWMTMITSTLKNNVRIYFTTEPFQSELA